MRVSGEWQNPLWRAPLPRSFMLQECVMVAGVAASQISSMVAAFTFRTQNEYSVGRHEAGNECRRTRNRSNIGSVDRSNTNRGRPNKRFSVRRVTRRAKTNDNNGTACQRRENAASTPKIRNAYRSRRCVLLINAARSVNRLSRVRAAILRRAVKGNMPRTNDIRPMTNTCLYVESAVSSKRGHKRGEGAAR